MIFSSDVPCQLHVLWHDGDPYCLDGPWVIIVKTKKVCFIDFLQCVGSSGLEPNIGIPSLHPSFLMNQCKGNWHIRRSVFF